MAHLIEPITEKDHFLGSLQAPKSLVVYGDYECAMCALSNPVLKQIQKKIGSDLCFAFRNFPLKQSHPNAFMAACAVESAGLQNHFWQMHDRVYENYQRITLESLLKWAEELGLEMSQFQADLSSTEIINKIENDFKMGVRGGVNGTPCFFINGQRYDGDPSYDGLLRSFVA